MFNYFYASSANTESKSKSKEMEKRKSEKTFFVSVRVPNEEKAQIWVHDDQY